MKKIMEQWKKIWAKHRKAGIATVAAVVVLAMAGGICLAWQPNRVSTMPATQRQEENTKEDSDVTEVWETEQKQEEPQATPSPSATASAAPKASDDKAQATETAGTKATSKQTKKASGTESSSTGSTTSAAQSQSSANSGTTEHTHQWEPHTVQRWVPNIVTVVDTPEQTEKVTLYRIYWWDTKTWQDTKDPAVFDEWYRKKADWLREYQYPDAMPPELYLGDDENGNPRYTNDHSIITYYETVPAVTHEEDQGHYETDTDYYVCACGATKPAE
jgi:hypothetical protein